MPFTLEELLPDDQQLRTVQMHEAVTHAIDLMHGHCYSQLPVMGGMAPSIQNPGFSESISVPEKGLHGFFEAGIAIARRQARCRVWTRTLILFLDHYGGFIFLWSASSPRKTNGRNKGLARQSMER